MSSADSDSDWKVIVRALNDRGASGLSAEARRPVSGGCIHDAQRLDGDPPLFVKTNAASRANLFDFEAQGLELLRQSGTVCVPKVFARGLAGGRAFLALEWLDLVPLDPTSGARLGAELAQLHRTVEPQGRFGFDRDNTLGSTLQCNDWARTWSGFWRDRRLAPLFSALDRRSAPIARADELLDRVEALLQGHEPAPALLHGDLWSGNAAALTDGTPVVFDPAVSWGDPETDLAMSRLFGGFPSTFYDEWELEFGRTPGAESRCMLYQLYHVLNHALLFGGPYGRQAEDLVRRLVR